MALQKKKLYISVIIPVYNVSSYIERCIKSVILQTYDDFECIIVDDASSDDSIIKCERMIEDYKGTISFRIIRHEQNRGLSSARNTGTKVAKGDYILYIDSDDAITKDCIEKLIAPILKNDTIEMVMGNFEQYDIGSQVIHPIKQQENEDYSTTDSVRYCYFKKSIFFIMAWNKLIRKDFLFRNNLSFKEGLLYEDFLWTFYVMKYLNHLSIIKDVTYLRYQRSGSICRGTDKKTKQYHYGLIYDEISKNLTPEDSHRETVFYIKGFCSYYIDSAKNESYINAAQNYRKELSFWHDPFEVLLLLVTRLLGKNIMGRVFFHAALNGWRFLKKI